MKVSATWPNLRRRLWVVAAGIALVAVASVAARSFAGRPAATHFADAEDRQQVLRGKLVYMERCASCHGRYLQGQPLWQLADPAAHLRAPAHDQSGHTWQHGDEALFVMTKFGHFPDKTAPAGSAMPGFEDVLDDRDILAALAFIKARWPVGLRVLQAARNPGQLGMPSQAQSADWRLPADCMPR